MKKAVILSILIVFISVTVQAALFTPNQPEGRGIYLFDRPAYSATQHSGTLGSNSWTIMHGERVRVNHLRDNGWAEVTAINPKGAEQDGYILMRMLVPIEGDENAAALFAQFKQRTDWEMQVMKWGVILAVAGLAIYFMWFLGDIRRVLLPVIVAAYSVLIIHFLWNTEGFTYFLPSVYGWKWASIWFTCFSVFLVLQVFLFIKAIDAIEMGVGLWAGGANLIVMICIVMFYALYLGAGIFADLIWRPLTVPFAWVDENFTWIFLGAQVVVAISLINFIEDGNKLKAFLIIPLYFVSFAAIALMFKGMILGYIVAIGAFLVISALSDSKSEVKTPMTGEESARREDYKQRMEAWHRQTVQGWKEKHWRG